jgi:hypothetical protein
MHNEELEPAFRQTAALLDHLAKRLENDRALNQPHAVMQLTQYVASQIQSAHRFSRIRTTDSELNETLLTHQLANLSRAGRHVRTLSANLNRQDPETGRRYGDHLEATAHSIGELRWQLRENSAQFLHQKLEQHHNRQIGSAYQTNRSFRQPAKSGGEYALPANQYDPTDTAIRQGSSAQEQAHTVTTVTTDRTIEVPEPAQTVAVEDYSRTRKLDNGFAIW